MKPENQHSHELSEDGLGPPYILVVDDEESICSVLQAGIKRAGYECKTACNSKEALQVLDKWNVDVVITDINMPGMNGDELTKVVKRRYDADVIIMTGYVENFRYEKAIESGANDFVEKPVSLEELVVRLKRVLMERELLKEKLRAQDDLKQSLVKLRSAIDGAAQAIALTVEARDPYTAGHQKRVADLAKGIARNLKLPADQVDGIVMAGMIHDLGKISVPAEILSKPTRLSEVEFSLIKCHPGVGYDILKAIDFPWPVAQMVLQHHERMDGSGYPQSLSGDEILLEARILAVADVIEAMASHRPYRPSRGIGAALDEIRQNEGALYDTHVVRACIGLFEEGEFQFESAPL